MSTRNRRYLYYDVTASTQTCEVKANNQTM